jgi:hypothetical protein
MEQSAFPTPLHSSAQGMQVQAAGVSPHTCEQQAIATVDAQTQQQQQQHQHQHQSPAKKRK